MWISDHLDVFPAPAVSLGYHSGFMLFHSALLHGGNSNTEVNAEREWGKRGKTERIETRHPSKWQPRMCMMDAFGYNLTERVYPCMCGVELWLSCLSVYVSHSCIQAQVCLYICVRVCDCIYSSMSVYVVRVAAFGAADRGFKSPSGQTTGKGARIRPPILHKPIP